MIDSGRLDCESMLAEKGGPEEERDAILIQKSVNCRHLRTMAA